MKVGSMSPRNMGNCPRQKKNDSVTNCSYATKFEYKNDLFSEKLQKFGTML